MNLGKFPPNTVLLDNATLRNSLIALGFLEPKTKVAKPLKIFDSGILAAEIFVESLLLHDHILVPKLHSSDYPETVTIAQSHLNDNVLLEYSFEKEQLSALEGFALRDFSKWSFASENVVKQLRQFVGTESSVISWDKWVAEKYSEASAYYVWSRHEEEVTDFLIDLDRVSKEYPKDIINNLRSEFSIQDSLGQTDAIILWLGYRTCIYDVIGFVLDLPYIPHPHRAALWKAVNLRRSQPLLFENLPFDVLFDARVSVGQQFNKSTGFETFDLEIPHFFTYILSKTDNPADVLKFVSELRETKGVKKLRETIKTMTDLAHVSTSIKDLNILGREFNKFSSILAREYGIEGMPKISPAIQLGTVFGVQFDVELPNQLSAFLSKLHTTNRPHLAFLRELFQATTNVWKLADIYDRMYFGKRKLARKTIIKPKPTLKFIHHYSSARYFSKMDTEDPALISPRDCRERLQNYLSNQNQSCTVIILDIDGLDQINISKGHKLGDQVLHNVSMILRKLNVDALTKVAGDTFIALVFGKVQLDRWLAKFNKELNHLSELVEEQLSVSFGIAKSPMDAKTADELLKIAYSRLVEAKQNKSINKKHLT